MVIPRRLYLNAFSHIFSINILLTTSFSFPISALNTWVNCKGNQTCSPEVYLEPSTVEELCDSIQQNAIEGRKVRAIGNGHSVNDIGCSEGCLLNLKHLNHILSINTEEKTVRVEAGILIGDLNELLAVHSLSLPNQAAIAELTLGGAITTAVHGSGHTGSLSSFIKEFELITADGVLHKFSLDSDPEVFSALCVGLGSLGIIYAVTVQCESLFYVNATTRTTDIETIVKSYTNIHAANDFCHFLWNVETGRVVIKEWNRCSEDDLSKNTGNEHIPCYQALAWDVVDKKNKDLFSEIAIPVNEVPYAIQAIHELVLTRKISEVKVYDIYIRFVESEPHALLSPSSQEPVAYFTFSLSEGNKFMNLYKEFEEIMDKYKGRPHWGKINFLDVQKVSDLYGKNVETFLRVKHRLDPQEIFSNEFTDRLFTLKHD